MALTLKEEMAMAVLKGDDGAAYALADELIRELQEGDASRTAVAEALRLGPHCDDSYNVYHWPEFQAFAKRLGILWDLRTIDLTIKLIHRQRVVVEQTYAACDNSDVETHPPINTTTAHNQEFETYTPLAEPTNAPEQP